MLSWKCFIVDPTSHVRHWVDAVPLHVKQSVKHSWQINVVGCAIVPAGHEVKQLPLLKNLLEVPVSQVKQLFEPELLQVKHVESQAVQILVPLAGNKLLPQEVSQLVPLRYFLATA